jgi:hypothetical protein
MTFAHTSRAIIVTCALATLTACAGGNSSAELSPAAQPAAVQTTPPAPAAPAPKTPVTPEKAKAECWMKYEGDKHVKNIDQRLVLVEKCVDDTMRNQPPTRAER